MKAGTKLGRWTVVDGCRIIRNGSPKLKCRCECGTEREVNLPALKGGRSTSCGCLARELASIAHTKHGKINTPEYQSWSAMRARCLTKTNRKYPDYGGRGITICDRWKVSFENFLADMGERPKGMTLDRRDNSGNYEPDNCRWATPKQQLRNTRYNVNLTAFGRTRCLMEWVEVAGIKRGKLRSRLKRGWSAEMALSTP